MVKRKLARRGESHSRGLTTGQLHENRLELDRDQGVTVVEDATEQ